MKKIIITAVLSVVLVLGGCSSTGRMSYGQYNAIKNMCKQQGLQPMAITAYKDGSTYTKKLLCYDEYGAVFDFTKQ